MIDGTFGSIAVMVTGDGVPRQAVAGSAPVPRVTAVWSVSRRDA